MKIVIVGGGIIGAALAHKVSRAGADVTVFEGAPGATPASFGWVNASFFLTPDHFALRAAGIAAWRRLGGHVAWTGCLSWEEEGVALDAQRDRLAALGYEVEDVDAARFAALEPHVAPPARAVRFAQEGVAAPAQTLAGLLSGVRRVTGVQVTGLRARAGNITGIDTALGPVAADRVIVAAGTGSPAVLATVGVDLPMSKRPGLMLRTAPVAAILRHVLVAPDQELRQDDRGHIWAPASASHQGDDATTVSRAPDLLADAARARLSAMLPDHDLAWDRVMMAQRPMPQDGLPVIGPCGPEGLHVAVMHSGITLAAITAELVSAQVLGRPLSNTQATLVAPFTPLRFQSG